MSLYELRSLADGKPIAMVDAVAALDRLKRFPTLLAVYVGTMRVARAQIAWVELHFAFSSRTERTPMITAERIFAHLDEVAESWANEIDTPGQLFTDLTTSVLQEVAKAVNEQPELQHLGDNVYQYSVDGTWRGVPLVAMAVSRMPAGARA